MIARESGNQPKLSEATRKILRRVHANHEFKLSRQYGQSHRFVIFRLGAGDECGKCGKPRSEHK